MILYVCKGEKSHADLPGPLAHPCGKAAKALDEAGHDYEMKVVQGQLIQPWTWRNRARDRAEVEELSGSRSVPILVLGDGEVIAGSAAIVSWSREHPPAG